MRACVETFFTNLAERESVDSYGNRMYTLETSGMGFISFRIMGRCFLG